MNENVSYMAEWENMKEIFKRAIIKSNEVNHIKKDPEFVGHSRNSSDSNGIIWRCHSFEDMGSKCGIIMDDYSPYAGYSFHKYGIYFFNYDMNEMIPYPLIILHFICGYFSRTTTATIQVFSYEAKRFGVDCVVDVIVDEFATSLTKLFGEVKILYCDLDQDVIDKKLITNQSVFESNNKHSEEV